MCVAVDGCKAPQIEVQLVRLQPNPKKLKGYCRPHYVEYARARGTLVRVEVVGSAIIVSADGRDVEEGGFALLNTEETDVQMLVDLGYVGKPELETVPEPAPPAAAKAEKAK